MSITGINLYIELSSRYTGKLHRCLRWPTCHFLIGWIHTSLGY